MDSIDLADINLLFKLLENKFGGLNSTGTVKRKINSLEQQYSDFSGCLNYFSRIASKVKYDDLV